MRKKEIVVVNNLIKLTDDVKSCLNACLSDFNTWDNDGSTLVEMFQYLLKNEGYGLEMSGIQISSDSDGWGVDDFLKEDAGDRDVIVMNYDDRYIVLNEKIAAQYIVDWCAEFATHPDVPDLCEKIKEKYAL